MKQVREVLHKQILFCVLFLKCIKCIFIRQSKWGKNMSFMIFRVLDNLHFCGKNVLLSVSFNSYTHITFFWLSHHECSDNISYVRSQLKHSVLFCISRSVLFIRFVRLRYRFMGIGTVTRLNLKFCHWAR